MMPEQSAGSPTDFHRDCASADLDAAMDTLRRFTATFGVLNWGGNSALETVFNATGYHPLKQVVERLSEWLTAYEVGEAAVERWREISLEAIEVSRMAESLLLDAANHDNFEWLVAKLRAQVALDKDADMAEGAPPYVFAPTPPLSRYAVRNEGAPIAAESEAQP